MEIVQVCQGPSNARTIVFDLDFAVRMETAGDVTSGVAVEEVDVDFTVKSGDCW